MPDFNEMECSHELPDEILETPEGRNDVSPERIAELSAKIAAAEKQIQAALTTPRGG